MKFCIYLIITLFLHLQTSAQLSLRSNQVLTGEAIQNWSSFVDDKVEMSNDGEHCMYVIKNIPVGSSTLIVQSTRGTWKREFKGVMDGSFSGDNKLVVFLRSDTLWMVNLGGNEKRQIPDINAISFPKNSNNQWLMCEMKGISKQLMLLDLFYGKEKRFSAVDGYWFDKCGRQLLLNTLKCENGAVCEQSLEKLDLATDKAMIIWKTRDSIKRAITSCEFSQDGTQIVYTVEQNYTTPISTGNKRFSQIYYYKNNMPYARLLVENDSLGMAKALNIRGNARFTNDGNWVLFKVEEKIDRKIDISVSDVDIWSYRDIVLQPDQKWQIQNMHALIFDAIVDLKQGKVMRLTYEGEWMYPNASPAASVIISGANTDPWMHYVRDNKMYLLSLESGVKRVLTEGENYLTNISFSPTGRWLIYYDTKLSDFFTVDLFTGKLKNITSHVKSSFKSEDTKTSIGVPAAPVQGWLSEDKRVILCDNFDIWLVDPAGSLPAISVTKGYGTKNQIKLRLTDGQESTNQNVVFDLKQSVILTGFSPVTKFNGFFSKKLSEEGPPKLLYFGPYTFYRTESQKPHNYSFDDGMQPSKARDSDIWMVKRQSAIEAPNYYLTEDFKTFRQVTNLIPHEKFNWITSELVTWKQLSGPKLGQGVLYKPKNFNSGVRYPVIINYYEKLSHRLNEFPTPDFTKSNINIPWFVSRGYLVFTPDIHFEGAVRSGKTTGEWAFNSVVSGVHKLSALPYIDTQRISLQGHSFGGGITNYLIAHSNLFAAASEVAGDSDPLSAYLTLVPFQAPFEHDNKQAIFERGRGRYEATPWERPDLYARNSAILNADKVETPLLIVHNERDNSVQFRQGVEMYLALRRLKKISWMLQYKNSGHGLRGNDAIDYTLRLEQFFDHYLKHAPASFWMTQGIPAKLKGVETGYALNPAGNCGKDCKVCKMWNEKWAKDSVATKQLIEKEEKNQWMGMLDTVSTRRSSGTE